MEEVHYIQPVIILLFVGILAIILARPLKLSPIVGYLIAGIVIGPHGLEIIEESETTHLLAELGVVFLLFDIGLHFSLNHIWDARRDILGLGPLQVIFCGAVFALLGSVVGQSLEIAILAGATLALSSTAVAVQTLAERGQQRCPVGVSATAVLIFQDICAIFLLIFASSLGNAESSLGTSIGLAIFKAVIAFVAAILIGRFLIGPMFKMIAQSKHEESFTALALLIVLGTAAATGLIELSLTLGAFLGGMIISETPYRHVIQTEVKPFRGLLLGFFFIMIGMSLNMPVVFNEWGQILITLVVLVLVKTALVYAASRVVQISRRIALQLGFLLSQGSEFAFVIFAVPAVQNALGQEISAILIVAVAGSMVLTPPLTSMGHRLAARLADKDWKEHSVQVQKVPDGRVPVNIFGMNEVGRRVADGLEAHDIPYTAFEIDHDRFVKAQTDGYLVAFGDLADMRLAETIKMAQARTITINITRYEISKALTPIVSERYPNLSRFVSVESEGEKKKFEALGMRAIVARSFPKGLDMAAAVLKAHDVDELKIENWMRRQQEKALKVGQHSEKALSAA